MSKQYSGRNWAVRLEVGMYAAGWGARAQEQRSGVHFVGAEGDWCRVADTPRAMTRRNAHRCIVALNKIGCVGAVVEVGGAA